MLASYPINIRQLALQENISEAALYNWRNQLRQGGRPVPEHHSSSENWSAQTRFAVVIETIAMSENELSEYCRAKVLFPEQVKQWHDLSIQAQSLAEVITPEQAQENKALRKQNKQLEREILRKDKGLAAALLILQKKGARPLGRTRGRLTSLEQRQRLTSWIRQACHAGASLYCACEIIGISVHSWYRWQAAG